MKINTFLFPLLILLFSYACGEQKLSSASDLIIQKTTLDSLDNTYGYYLSIKPKSDTIKGVLVLIPGFSQKAEHIFPETDLHKVAYENSILTIGISCGMKLTADSLVQSKISMILEDVITQFGVDESKFVLGGFSAGGNIALRYTELCKKHPKQYPIIPQAIFMADSPIDLFHVAKFNKETLANSSSEIALNEARFVTDILTKDYGTTPLENTETYRDLSPFSMDKALGENERSLRDVAVRTYHDVDIVWRLKERNQPVQYQNYVATSELINRLMLMGNEKAEFMQSYQTGYRANGQRHPHSWSIIDEQDCINWVLQELN